MAGMSGMSSLSGMSSIRGFGGLASGLDRDSLIEQLTYGTRTKIEQKKQKQTKLGWQQAAFRNIIDKAYDFTSKYTSYASSSNLTSSKLFSRTDISAVGENSKYISVTGKASSSDLFSILGVKQMAKDATLSGGRVSDATLDTGAIADNFETGTYDRNLLEGQYLRIKHGADTYNVKLSDFDYKNAEKPDEALADALNKALSETKLSGSKEEADLGSVLKASVVDGKVTFENTDTAGNSIEITGGTGDVLKHLGFLGEGQSIDDIKEDLTLSNGETVTATNNAKPLEETPLKEFLAGKTLKFSYNGTTKEIEIGEGLTGMDDLVKDLQDKLDQAFGKGRIKVGSEAVADTKTSKLTFKTVKPDGTQDVTSTFAIVGGDSGLLGKENGLFGIDSETGNRINLKASLEEAGFANKLEGTVAIRINGKRFEFDATEATVEDVMKAINESDAGVQISYQKNSDRFVMTSTQKGSSGEITINGEFGGLATAFFGKGVVGKTEKGLDAIISVKYAGDDQPVEIIRDSNSFDMDGMVITVKDEFGYTKDANNELVLDPASEEVTFDAKVDAENTTKIVKEMVDAFNDILKLVNTELRTKPNRGYEPLTPSQREEMSESEIKEYEAKAKEGLLFSDTDLRSMSDALRFVIPQADAAALREIGISVSSDYSDNGKIKFDETVFKAAMESDPEKVRDLFTRKASDEDGVKTESGFMERISNVMNRYAGTTGSTKGILVERAGTVHSPTSILKNSLQKQMDSIDKEMNRLLDRLEMEEDRYIAQFTTLESLIAQMNSQSSYLSQFGGGGY